MAELEHEVDKILRHITGKDDTTRTTLLNLADGLPLFQVASIRESCEKKHVGVGYAVNALRRARREFFTPNREE